MFSLSHFTLLLANVNIRSEIHGEEKKTAVDLKLTVKTSNDILSEFDPSLKSALYAKAQASQAELVNDPGHLPALKFPLMGPIKWAKEFAGYDLRIHWGTTGEQDIVLQDCQVAKFSFDCMDGGSVLFSFRVSGHPDAKTIGRLSEMIQQNIEVTLQPPESDEA